MTQGRFTPQQVALRARIAQEAASGASDKQIASMLCVHVRTVALWRRRVRTEGTGPPGADANGRLERRRCRDGSTRPCKRGRNLQPPKDAVVLCVDEKSQIHVLDRTQPGLPLMRGRCGTFTHEYQRHGTTCLFAALHVAKGNVAAECYPRHRHQEFIRFLRRIESEFPPPHCLHLILDNYAIHGHERVRAWLRKRPRFVLHFIPTRSSWLNLIERWFSELEQKTARRGAFRS